MIEKVDTQTWEKKVRNKEIKTKKIKKEEN